MRRIVPIRDIQYAMRARGASTSMRTAERARGAAARTARPSARRTRMHADTSMSASMNMDMGMCTRAHMYMHMPT